MPPKGKRSAASEKAKDLAETEDPLQAVILADSFETRFNPFTKERPRCLLPLANTPLIEYTLELLANSGIEEVYIYCGAHTDQLETYIKNSKWSHPTSSPFSVETIRSTSKSIGDAMRDLDKRGILINDFVVVYGDVVSNISIEAALVEHRARKAKDKNAIMTMVLREGNTDIHKGVGVSPVFTIDPARSRCLQYDQMRGPGLDGSHSLLLDEDVLLHSGAQELHLRHDLIDCGIDICTPDVLALWSDNFDYEMPRRGFLHSVLKDYELNGKTIHTYIEKEGYANRVRDLLSYHHIAKDILARKTMPLSPEGAFAEEPEAGDYGLINGATIKGNCFVGKGSSIGLNTIVRGSAIGRNCTIGEGCFIDGAYIWDNVTIGSGSEILHAIVADDVSIGTNCVIREGTMISFGAQLVDGTTTNQRQRLVRNPEGEGTEAIVDYTPHPESESDIEDSASIIPRKQSRHRGSIGSVSSVSTLHSSRSSSPDPEMRHRSLSMTSTGSDGPDSSFNVEAKASVYDSLLRGHDPANINLELQAQRLALNASEHAVRKAVVYALVDYIIHVREEQKAGKGGGMKVSEILKHNGDLVRRIIFDEDLAQKVDQVDLLLLVQKALVGKAEAEIVLLSICNGLYGEDLVQGEALVQWWEDPKGIEGEGMTAVRSHKQMVQLIDIARDESEEEDDEDDDEDESSEEE